MDSLELFLAIGFAALASVGALGFILFRQPVHAALSFAVTVLSGAGLYLLLNAPYAAIATVIVYAGATIIIFLFALMFAQSSKLQIYDREMANPIRSFIAAAALITILAYAALSFATGNDKQGKPRDAVEAVTPDSVADATPVPRVADLGRVMFTRYLWAIELAGAILLVATLGAIQIAREDVTSNLPTETPSP